MKTFESLFRGVHVALCKDNTGHWWTFTIYGEPVRIEQKGELEEQCGYDQTEIRNLFKTLMSMSNLEFEAALEDYEFESKKLFLIRRTLRFVYVGAKTLSMSAQQLGATNNHTGKDKPWFAKAKKALFVEARDDRMKLGTFK